MICGNVYAQKTKNRPFVSGRKDAVPPDFAFSTQSNKALSTSDNGLTRRKLTEKFRFISAGSRATGLRPHKDSHQPSSLWVRVMKAPPGHSRRNMKSAPFGVTGLRLRSTPTRRGCPLCVSIVSHGLTKISQIGRAHV